MKRIHLAVALLAAPRYLLLDEILDGIDEATIPIAISLVRQLAESSTVLITGHDRLLYESMADESYQLEAGSLTKVATAMGTGAKR